jgi:hypothetical protein
MDVSTSSRRSLPFLSGRLKRDEFSHAPNEMVREKRLAIQIHTVQNMMETQQKPTLID